MSKISRIIFLKKFLAQFFLQLSAGRIFFIAGLLLAFITAFRPPIDPDLGWHLKNGEYLLENHFKVARSDIYSHTMSDFPLIMHEWLSDVGMFLVYKKFGLLALSILFSIIAVSAFFLASLGVKSKKEYRLVATILAIIASIPILGARPQIINLFLFSLVILMTFIFRRAKQIKTLFWLPLILLIWVNLHGAFAVGIFFFGIFLGIEAFKTFLLFIVNIFKEKKKWGCPNVAFLFLDKKTLELKTLLQMLGVILVSLVATLINPYGWEIYREVFNTIFDKYAKSNIYEWLPVNALDPMSFQFLTYLFLLLFLILLSLKKLDYTYFFNILPFLFLAFSSWRHIPLFLIASTPLWVNIVESITGAELLKLVKRGWFVVLLLSSLFFISKQTLEKIYPLTASIENMSEVAGYPVDAVKWLKKNPIEGKMFNEYNWGGFLIWQLPEKKVFIDGRMASWRHEKKEIFKDFNTIVRLDNGWKETFQKYDLDFAVVYNNFGNNTLFRELGWKKVYEDQLSIIFVKN